MHEYVTRFRANCLALKMVGGNKILCHKIVLGKEFEQVFDNNFSSNKDQALKKASEEYEAMGFLLGASETHFGALKKTLAHSINV